MAFDLLDPTSEELRQMDAVALHRELTELRRLPRAVLGTMSTQLMLFATQINARGKAEESEAVMHCARLLYVLAHETPTATDGTTSGPQTE